MGLILDQTEVIYHIWLTCAICVLTTMVNIRAMRVLKTKEDNNTNWDCGANILISVEIMLSNLDVGFPLDTSTFCALRISTVASLSAFTRLVPVAIVLLHYIMVCHPVIFQNCGKEKGIWPWILGSVMVPCIAIWINNMYNSSITFRFLRCIGREEDFW